MGFARWASRFLPGNCRALPILPSHPSPALPPVSPARYTQGTGRRMGAARDHSRKNPIAHRAKPMRPWADSARPRLENTLLPTAWVPRAGHLGSCLRTAALYPSYPLIRPQPFRRSRPPTTRRRPGVGWVQRETTRAKTQLPSARNPCGRGQTVPSRGWKTRSCGRMGSARWASRFLPGNCRALPILPSHPSPALPPVSPAHYTQETGRRMGAARDHSRKNPIAHRAKPMRPWVDGA